MQALAMWIVLVAATVLAVESKPAVLACAFPDQVLAFSVFRHSLATNTSTLVSPGNEGLNFNAEYNERHGLTYTTDIGGRWHIRTTKTNITIESGGSLNDHARWCPARKRFLWQSTRDVNPVPNEGWSAVFTKTWDSSTKTFSPTRRLTPANMTDYSPSWGQHVHTPNGTEALLTVASGTGDAGGTDIVLMRITEEQVVTERKVIAKNGGWPTWKDGRTVLFHRNTGDSLDMWSIFAVDIYTGAESLLIANGLTPSVSDHTFIAPEEIMAYAFVDHATGFRQIALFNFSSNTSTQVTFSAHNHYNPFYDSTNGDVYFHKCRGGTMPNLRRVKSDVADLDVASVAGDFPSISPDGKQVSIIDANYYFFLSVSVFNIDGSQRRKVYNATHSWMTSWVNGSKIAFTSGSAFEPATDGSVQVSTVDTITGDVKKLTHNPHFNQGYPCYSPDGRHIVFRTSAVFSDEGPLMPGPYHLRIMGSEGDRGNARKFTRRLTPPPETLGGVIGDTHPHWGPDFIVFASDRGHPGRLTIWRIDQDGSNLKEIFDNGATNVHPTTTPDRKRIVFSSTIAGYSVEEISWPFVFFPRSELFVMNNDGTNLQRLTHDASTNANAYTGPQSLPDTLTSDGLETNCYFRDSTDPEAGAFHEKTTGKTTRAGCPLFKAQETAADHAVVRKHGVMGEPTPPSRRGKGRCPFSGK